MRLLLDTNVLARLAHRSHPHQSIAQTAIRHLFGEGHELRTVPQVLYEYWSVASRPADQNGLGFDVATVHQQVLEWVSLFPLLRDERGVFEPWLTLVSETEIRGKHVHDARLVAAMQRHGLSHLFTFNVSDFSRFASIEAIDPRVVAAT